MKICVITPGVAHAVPRTLSFARYFSEIHYVDMKGADDRELLSRHGVIYHAACSTEQMQFGRRELRRLLRSINPDGIVCHFASGSHFFHSILYNRCPVAVIAMGQDVFYDGGDAVVSPLQRLLIRMALRRCDYVSAKSVALAERVRSYGCQSPIEVNYWGASLRDFSPGDRRENRAKLGLPLNAPVILSPRAVEPRLNIHLIVEAFAAIRRDHPDALLVVLGRTNAGYRNIVESAIVERGLSENVRLAYEVNQDRLVEYYRASDIVVSMARSEGFPNSVLEVMACERPVLVGLIPQVKELLVDGVNASLCPIEPEAIASALKDMLDRPDYCQQLVREARKTVEQFADIEANGARFAKAFRAIVEQHRNSSGRSLASVLPMFLTLFAHAAQSRLSRVR
jgi:glycosyltransferase involved in cell wall biosynthesis